MLSFRLSHAVELAAGIGLMLAAIGLLELSRSRLGGLLLSPEDSSLTPPPHEPAAGSWPEASFARPEPVASYTLHARLDAPEHTIRARGTIHWRNTASVPTDELWFHLYLNAFENDRTLFVRSPWRASRTPGRATDYGFVEVRSLRWRELQGRELWSAAATHSPGDPEDRTDIRVPLPRAAQPGESLTLDVEFVAKLPRGVERTGYFGSFHMAAQWFPKLARLERDGSWAHFPFHPQSEFYADFGDYDVTLDVPAGFVVGATGSRVAERADPGRHIVRHVAANVHDFAFAAWDQFRQELAVVEHTELRVLYPSGHELNARRTIEMVRFALPRFSRLYGDYPWPTLTVVHPPSEAPQLGGMEYPTLITTGAPWYAPYVSRAVEIVTVHELAHQWFQGLIATNEFKWPFLDEGLATYAESEAMRARFGPGNVTDLFGLSLDASAVRRAQAAHHEHEGPIAQPAASFSSFSEIGALVYSRTGTLFETLARVYGKDAVMAFLGEYARTQRFRHPGPDELIATARAHLGEDAAEGLRRALFERGHVNYRAGDIECARVTTPGGSYPAGPDEPRELRQRSELTPPRYRCRALLLRDGTLAFPVEVELIDAAGRRRREHWATNDSARYVEHEGEQPLVMVIVDPDRRVLLDSNMLDNARRTEPERPWRTFALATYLAQLALRSAVP